MKVFFVSKVSSWMFLEHMIDLGSSTPTVNLDIYKEHGEWDIIGTSVVNKIRQEAVILLSSNCSKLSVNLNKVIFTQTF
jgi:hypothetical protein